MTREPPSYYLRFGAAELLLGRVDASIAALDEARGLTPGDPGAPQPWFNLATLEAANGEPSAQTWRRFLRVERDPAWAEEGRRQLEAITATGR